MRRIWFFRLKNNNIHIGEYLTFLPSKEMLEQRLHLSVERARLSLNNGKQQATHIYNELINGKIILLNPPSYDDDKAFYHRV